MSKRKRTVQVPLWWKPHMRCEMCGKVMWCKVMGMWRCLVCDEDIQKTLKIDDEMTAFLQDMREASAMHELYKVLGLVPATEG